MIHFDTSFLIHALVPSSPAEAKVLSWLTAGEDFGVSTIAWSEFLCGPLSPQDEALARLILAAPEAFNSADARKAAELFNHTGRRSRSLPDCQIAAVALRCGAPVATNNPKDFAVFQAQGLALA
jgi:predicted nucleic acid-binding protein